MSEFEPFDDGLARIVDPSPEKGRSCAATSNWTSTSVGVAPSRTSGCTSAPPRARRGDGPRPARGSAWLGKTSLAHIIAEELGVEFAGQRSGHRAWRRSRGHLHSLGPRVLFVTNSSPDRAVEEVLYPALEDLESTSCLDGPGAQSVSIDLPRFTLVGAGRELAC